jgi:membrane protein
MAFQRVRALLDWLGRIMTQPRDELNRFQKTLRFIYDLGRHGARQLQHDRAPQMAGALAFRTLFALLPVLVVSTLIFRGLKGYGDLEAKLAEFFAAHELDKLQVTTSASDEAAVAGGESLAQWLMRLIQGVEEINLAAIGWVGVAVVIYAAIGLMVTIEKSFNIIYRAPEGRSWPRRLSVYWTVLTLGPGALVVAMWVGNWLETVFPQQAGWWSVFRGVPALWNYIALWLVTFAIYKLVPNTNVTYKPALFGALLAAILLELGQRLLAVYFAKAVMVGQLYGSLGLIPLFMFWVYVMWLIVLFGLEVSATLQMLGGRRRLEEIEARERTGLVDPTSVLLVMQFVARQFEESRPTTAREVADEVALPESTVVQMIEQLIVAGILHRLDREDGAISLARPPDQISADELVEVGYRLADEGVERRPALIERLRDAQKALAGQVTLANLASDQAAT